MWSPVMFMVNTWPGSVMRCVLSSDTTNPEPSISLCRAGNVSTSKMSAAEALILRVITIVVSSLMFRECPARRGANRFVDRRWSSEDTGGVSGEVTVTAERQLRHRPARVFRAFVEPAEFAQWRGSPGWHVELESVRSEPQVGGRHHHVKVRDDDPVARVTTDAEFVEFAPPELIVARQRISGDLAIDPRTPLTLRVEFGES